MRLNFVKLLKQAVATLMTAAMVITIAGATVEARSSSSSDNGDGTFTNPNVYLDVPDIDMIRVDENYYMVSTTMHMSPGCPILKSTDLVNWETCNYVYDRLADSDAANLTNGKDMYGAGQWAASIKYYNERYYVAFNSNTTGTAYIFSTDDIENGSWDRVALGKGYHDCALFHDENGDGKYYLVYGNNTIQYVELEDDLSGVKQGGKSGVMFVGNIGEDGKSIFSNTGGLGNEGSHVYYKDGYYYVFTINNHPGKRTEVVHRSEVFPGKDSDWTTRVVLETSFDNYGVNYGGNGVAQGGIIDTVDGDWYCYLFQDHDGVGRVPVLTKLTWGEDGWPAAGENGDTKTVKNIMDMPGTSTGRKTLVKSDEFYNDAAHRQFESDPLVTSEEAEYNGSNLDLCWEWNHNPDNQKWSLTERNGYLRLHTVGTAKGWLSARNTLTQRTYGPTSSYSVSMDVSNMSQGDIAGIGGLANKYGYVGVKYDNDGQKKIIMVDGSKNSGAHNADAAIAESVNCENDLVYLKADFKFADETKEYDQMNFYYSYDGVNWTKIGTTATTAYDINPMFMGIRVGIFNYATTGEGGYVDVDYFHVTDELTGENEYVGDAAAELKVNTVPGIVGGTSEAKLYIDNIPGLGNAKIKASIVIPEGISVSGVEFNNTAIKNGLSSYTFENGRLILNVTGKDITFDAADKLFASLTLKSDKDCESDIKTSIKTDFIQVDDGYTDYNVSSCSPEITIKALNAEQKAFYQEIVKAEELLSKLANTEKASLKAAIDTAKMAVSGSSDIVAAKSALAKAVEAANKSLVVNQPVNATPVPTIGTVTATPNVQAIATAVPQSIDYSKYVNKTFKVGKIKYKVITCSDGKGTVTVIGSTSKKLSTITIPASVKYSGMKFNVGAINKKAFCANKKLAKIIIKSKTIKSIGKNAFKGIKKNAVFSVPKAKKTVYKKMLVKAKTSKFVIK